MSSNRDMTRSLTKLPAEDGSRQSIQHAKPTYVRHGGGDGIGRRPIQVTNGVMSNSVLVGMDDSSLEDDFLSNGSQQYVDEWNRLFSSAEYLPYIKSLGMQGKLRSCRFRSVCWRAYLECLSEDPKQWVADVKKGRERYEDLKKRYLKNPRTNDYVCDLQFNNPLSQDEQSPWNRYFQDSELKVTIKQDVIRTFPEIEFFHTQEVRDMMVNILFCYAREYPQMSYKQGMHELLAPVIFVLHSDHQAFLHAVELEFLSSFDAVGRDAIKVILDPSYVEHDAFHMFFQIMEEVEQWYLVRDIFPPRVDTMNVKPFARPQDLNPTNAIIVRLTRVHDQLLRRHDSDLYQHLERLEIAPQIYGIRWLRLLFGREYPLQDLLVIWDVIFADSMTFDLVDYIFISMLKFIRNLLLTGDYAACLGYLMRYPAVTDVQYIVDEALHLRDPGRHQKPSGYSSSMLQHLPTVGGRHDIHRAPLSQQDNSSANQAKLSNKITSGFSSLRRRAPPKTLALQESLLGSKAKSASEPATFESRSPSPTLSEYVNKEHHQLETRELQPMSARSHGKHRNNDETTDNGATGAANQKGHARKGSWGFKKSKDASKSKEVSVVDIAYLQGQLNETQGLCAHCAQMMSIHIDRLQECVLHRKLENDDEMLVALAGLKQVRDILKGTLKYSQNLLEAEDIVINDNHYPVERRSEEKNMVDESEENKVSQLEPVHNGGCGQLADQSIKSAEEVVVV